jgi:hypothetical protein
MGRGRERGQAEGEGGEGEEGIAQTDVLTRCMHAPARCTRTEAHAHAHSYMQTQRCTPTHTWDNPHSNHIPLDLMYSLEPPATRG